MVIWNNGYYNSMDRGYHQSPSDTKIGRGIVRISDVGQSIIDGSRGGRFQQSIQAAIRAGAGSLELAPKPEVGFGVETYGKDEREEMKQIAKINRVDLQGVHAPPEIVGDLTGRTNEGFSEQKRDENLEEIKKHIDFAADVLDGGHIVVHTGEFPRSIAKAKWNKGSKFEAYKGEAEESVYYLVDPHTGKLMAGVKENEEVFMPKLDPNTGQPIFNEELGQFEVELRTFKKFREEKQKQDPKKYGDNYVVAKEFMLEQKMTDLQRSEGQALEYESRFARINGEVQKINSQLEQAKSQNAGEETIKEIEKAKKYYSRESEAYREVALSARRSMKEQKKMLDRVQTIEEFGKQQAFDSLAQLGIYAMDVEKSKKTERPIYLAPENVFPQMGYGAHPEELIEFVEGARQEMVKQLTSQQVYDRKKKEMIQNPSFQKGLSERQAGKLAEKHIKATFDTQHLGMWYKHFKSNPGETEEQRVGRFNNWYMDQVKQLEKSGIIGQLHIVDGFGRGHQHLVPGEGMFPVVTAVEYLKKKGYSGHMMSEAYESQGRTLTGVWEAFGSPIYHAVGAPGAPRFSDIQHSYFGRANPTPYTFGAYAPSEDWTLWSGVPLE